MEQISQGHKIYKFRSLPKNQGVHMNHSIALQQPDLLTNKEQRADEPSNDSQKGRTATPLIIDHKVDSKYDCYADRLGSPKRMR